MGPVVTPEKKKFPTIAKINNPITRSTATLARGPIDKIIVLIKALRPGLFPARRAILVTLRTRIIFVICPDDLALGPVPSIYVEHTVFVVVCSHLQIHLNYKNKRKYIVREIQKVVVKGRGFLKLGCH